MQIIYNPKSGGLHGGADTIQRLVAALRANGLNIEDSQVKATTASGDATRLAQEAVAQKIEVLIACGGDGTINETAQALVGTSTALAILPSGTANVLAKEMRLPRRPEELAK